MHRKLNFTLSESPIKWRTHRIMDLCDYLSGTVLEPMFEKEHVRWNRRFMDFVTFDNSCNPQEATGTIRFAIPPMFAGRVGELLAAIVQELSRLKIEVGPFTYERDAHGAVRTLIIHVIDNPTVLHAPPDVNMSHTWSGLVLRDLLGYQRRNGKYEFTADDLVKRVSSVTEDKIAACIASPVKGAEGIRRTPSPISVKAIRRCLEEVRAFGIWALSHNHRQLAAI
jgi:hypothetical protein